MAERIVLNEISYHGSGAIAEIVGEVKGRGFEKGFVCSDPDLVKFNVTSKVTDLLEKESLPYELYSNIKPNPTIEMFRPESKLSRQQRLTISSQLAEVPLWIPPRP